MREKGVKLRLVLLIIVITIVIGQVVPTMVFAEGNTVVNYEPKRQKYAIAPQNFIRMQTFTISTLKQKRNGRSILLHILQTAL